MNKKQLAIKCAIHAISQHCKDASFSIKDGNDYRLMKADEALILLADLLTELENRKTTKWIIDKDGNVVRDLRIRTGKWIDEKGKVVPFADDGCPEKSCFCSKCGEWLVASDEYPVRGNYCPNCGAKMEDQEAAL